MLKLAAGVSLVMVCIQAQTFRDLLLPEARHVTGVVIDAGGKPIVNARIEHTDDRLKAYQTDSEGRFELDTRAPILVIRKAGFRSELVRTQHAPGLRITLQKSSENRTFPICPNTGPYDGIEGWRASFQFPRTSGVKASLQRQGIDYGARTYYVETKQGRKGILHGSGPLWDFGLPDHVVVWESVKYEEVTYDVGGRRVIDAQGQLPNGNRWRYLGKLGESASYSNMDQATARILDQILDGACLTSRAGR